MNKYRLWTFTVAMAAVLALPNFGVAGEFKLAGAKSDKALKAEFSKRLNSRSCEPIAPMETRLVTPVSGVIGQQIPLRFEGMLTEFAANGDYRVDLPEGVRLVAGKSSDKGQMDANKGYAWDLRIVVDRPGDYVVNVQLLAGDSSYEFGQRQQLYVHATNTGIALTTEKPNAGPPPIQTEPMPAQRITETVFPNLRQVGPPPETGQFNDATDPFGVPLDNRFTGVFTDAPATVTGTWRYRHTDGTLHNGYGTWAEAWDDDTVGADDFLGRTTVDSAGNYSISFDNADDVGFGTADVYLTFRSENTRIQVHNSGATSGYSTSTGVLFSNIGTGTFNGGGWFADWGTNGVSDNNERAFQICDDMTTAWQHWRYATGVLFDNRLTYVQWYIGSTDGSYYVRAENRIYTEDSDVSSVDVSMHEYGHSMHDGLFDDLLWPPGTGGPHSFTGHYTTGLAWTEGFGTYYSCTAQNNDWIYNSYDPGNLITFDCDANWDGNGSANGNSDGLSNSPNHGYDTESAVLSFMLDIDDSRNSPTDPYDWASLGDDEIFDSMRNYTTGGHRPYSIQEFFDGWHSIVDVQNPKINGLMHNHGMDQPINFPELGIYDGVNGYAGTWYYGGYGRGSFDVKNYSSRNYNLSRLYVWLLGPGGEDVGQFGSDGDNTPIPSGGTRNIWITADQTGYNPAAPNFVYGNYRILAGHYRSDGAWQRLQTAESGTADEITKNVIQDTTAPPSCTVVDDGAHQTSLTQIHIVANSSDPESSIDGYWTRVGSSPGAGDYQAWVLHPANNQTTFDYTITGLAIPNGATAYVTVVSQNIHSADSPFAYTDGIKCGDTTAPGAVTVTDQGTYNAYNDRITYSATTTEPDGGIYQWWSRVGTAAGLGDISPWISYDIHTLFHNNTITGLSMPTGARYFVTSVARNYGFQDTFGYSNGILSPLYPTGLALVNGIPFGGNLASVERNDANRYFILCDEDNSTGTINFGAVCPVTGGSNLHVITDTSATRVDMIQFTDLYNYSTSSFQTVDSRATTFADNQVTTIRPTAAQYIQAGSRNMVGRLRFIPTADLEAADGWSIAIDRFNWYVEP